FAGMGWIVPAWGTRAVVYAGQGTKDHLRAALQLLSGAVPSRTIFRHLGWREIGGAWFYLHGGGAIGADGLAEGIPLVLPDPLAGCRLPAALAPVPLQAGVAYGELGHAAQAEAAGLTGAVRASLGLLRLGPDRLTFPLLAAAYRAVLGDTDF